MAYVIAFGNVATVIDCTCDLDSSVLRVAEEKGLKISNVIDIHMHADHVSELSTLVKKIGTHGYYSDKEGFEPANDLVRDATPIIDGYKIPIIGEVEDNDASLTAIHTPGHTQGSMCFVLNLDSQIG
jgi:glyoxylase-like metal-dependent hydrolase (beta-lactamase superfamily II)